MFVENGVLYIVATPIGNLGDISRRALEILENVDLIAAEDTRNSQKLLNHFGIKVPMMALHEHNEREQADEIIKKLQAGTSIALISDAGTPLISDPGYTLVSRVHDQGIKVTPIPGASALIAALSVSGIATDRFCFEGFLPAKAGARDKQLKSLLHETRTLVFYEAPHRLVDCLTSLVKVFGPDRNICLVREVTKMYETIKRDRIGELLHWVTANPQQQKGESVLVVEGAPLTKASDKVEIDTDTLLRQLLEKVSLKDAAHIAASITGQKKNALYEQALEIQKQNKQQD
ncbi:MAG: 16S rRNA (cytidine(1402)-2'-O)-methyltransferase [Thioalkalispiraceae bacterium]